VTQEKPTQFERGLHFTATRAGGAHVLTLGGSIDGTTAPSLDDRLAPLLALETPRILIDLAGTSYISSAGLRSFVAASQSARARAGEVALCSPQKHVREVFLISGLDRLFPLYRSREAYLARSLGNFADEPADAELSPLVRNKRAVLRFLMILQFCTYAEMPVVADPAMVTRLSPSLVHGTHGNVLPSAGAFEDHLQHLHSTQDIEIVIESMIAEGDEVATNNLTRRHYRDGRFMTTRYLSFYRLRDGRIVEKTDVYDRLHEQQQLATPAGMPV
jgi:anti-anti-sigma factor